MKDIATPKIPRVFPYVLSEEEVSSLLKSAKPSKRDYAILFFLLDTGVRESELSGLKLDDITNPFTSLT